MSTDSKKSKRRPGRPKKPKGESKYNAVIVRVNADEKRRVEAAAKTERKTVSEWAREKLGLV